MIFTCNLDIVKVQRCIIYHKCVFTRKNFQVRRDVTFSRFNVKRLRDDDVLNFHSLLCLGYQQPFCTSYKLQAVTSIHPPPRPAIQCSPFRSAPSCLFCCYVFIKYEELYIHCLFAPSIYLIEFVNKLVRLATVSCIARSLRDVADTSDNNIVQWINRPSVHGQLLPS